MSFGSGQDFLWPVTPDWSSGIRERLSWSTAIHIAPKTAFSQHVAEWVGPQRSLQFETLDGRQTRRVVDALLQAQGPRSILVPIWPDEQLLRDPHAPGQNAIGCRTMGFDFYPEGRALLWRGLHNWELVTIESIGPDGLTLSDPLSKPWPPGTHLYPVRRGRLDQGAQIHTITDETHRTGVRARLEPSEWPAIMPSTTYLGHPVLEQAPDDGENRSLRYGRLTEKARGADGADVEFDLAGVAMREQSHVWELWGRAQQSEFRSLIYALRGRQVPLWVPTWSSDLQPVAPIADNSTLLAVEWSGYTALGGVRPNRRDIRIELQDGTVFLRRLVGSAEDGNSEVVQLDAPLGQAVTPNRVRRISWMGLATLASDEIEWHHVTGADGRARVSAGWKEVLPDV